MIKTRVSEGNENSDKLNKKVEQKTWLIEGLILISCHWLFNNITNRRALILIGKLIFNWKLSFSQHLSNWKFRLVVTKRRIKRWLFLPFTSWWFNELVGLLWQPFHWFVCTYSVRLKRWLLTFLLKEEKKLKAKLNFMLSSNNVIYSWLNVWERSISSGK